MTERLQRSEHLVACWRSDRLHLREYLTGTEVAADEVALAILSRAARPVPRAALLGASPAANDDAIERLLAAGMLRRRAASPGEADADAWRSWAPEAGLFHFATKDHPFRRRPASELRVVGAESPPPPLKEDPPGTSRVPLPTFGRDGELREALLRRRTWRRFGNEPLSTGQLAELLGLTWAVQHWAPGIDDQRLAFKTSPSGGAKHSIEVYVAALRVEGLEPGTYHYCPDRHALARAAGTPDDEQLAAFLPAQPFYGDAAALFFMTSVFSRVQSRYRFPRAYRVVLLEAGHLAQTFCLLATSLGLAPFCTAALGDSAIEEHLGIDGVDESVLYVAGAGTRPAGVAWAPFDDERPVPELAPPRYRQRDDG